MKVLIIEDSQDVVTSFKLCFSILWSDALVVSTNLGASGIEKVKTEAPDIIVLDLGLPDMDGRNVLEEVRKFSTIPIVVLSVRNQESDKTDCFKAGANDYITKPYSAIALVARIRSMVNRK